MASYRATPRQSFWVTLRKMFGGGRKACSKGRGVSVWHFYLVLKIPIGVAGVS